MSIPTPVDLTGYLSTLATEVGYQIELTELDPACGHHPDLVLAWATAGARHAGLAYARSLLAAPLQFLHEQANTPDLDARTAAETLLRGLYQHDELLTTELAATRRTYRAALARLTSTGLTWPAHPAQAAT